MSLMGNRDRKIEIVQPRVGRIIVSYNGNDYEKSLHVPSGCDITITYKPKNNSYKMKWNGIEINHQRNVIENFKIKKDTTISIEEGYDGSPPAKNETFSKTIKSNESLRPNVDEEIIKKIRIMGHIHVIFQAGMPRDEKTIIEELLNTNRIPHEICNIDSTNFFESIEILPLTNCLYVTSKKRKNPTYWYCEICCRSNVNLVSLIIMPDHTISEFEAKVNVINKPT